MCTATSPRRSRARSSTPTTGRCRECCTASSSARASRAALIRGIDTRPRPAVDGRAGRDDGGRRAQQRRREDASGLGIEPIVMPVLAADRVRYSGEPVVLIAAETPWAAELAAALVELDIEEQPGVFEVDAALATRRAARACRRQPVRRVAVLQRRPGWGDARAPTWSSRRPTARSTSTTPTSSPRPVSAGSTATASSRCASRRR